MNIHYDKKRNTNIKQLHRTFNMLRHNLSTLCVLTLWSLYIPFSYLKIQFCGIHQFKCSTLNSTRAFLIAQLVKNPPVMQETPVWGLIPGSGISPGEGKGYPLQYSGLENSMDCIVPWGHKESDMTERLSLSLWIVLDYSRCWSYKQTLERHAAN